MTHHIESLEVKKQIFTNVNPINHLNDLGNVNAYFTGGLTKYSGLFHKASDDQFYLYKDLQEKPTTTVNISGTGFTYGTLKIGSLKLDDTNSAFFLNLVSTSTITTADKTLTLNINDSNRSVNMSGNLTIANDFITSGNNSLTLTTTGSTNVTLPTTGTLVNLNSAQTLTTKTFNTGSNTFTVGANIDMLSTYNLLNMSTGTSATFYQRGSETLQMQSANAPADTPIAVRYSRVDKTINFSWPQFGWTGNGVAGISTASTAIPAEYRPDADQFLLLRGKDNNTRVQIFGTLGSNGVLRFFRDFNLSNWTSGPGASQQVDGGSFTFTIA
jgi:hypothetical protein